MTTLQSLLSYLSHNRFMPVPPPALMSCGDGDFRAIGAEFLGYFVELGGLQPQARMLEIGCGVGRLALPLTQYLADEGTYEGIDVDDAAIGWCHATITPFYPNFRFAHLDVKHPLYHPAGQARDDQVVLPYPDGTFDFVCMVSVLTHLDAGAVTRYAQQTARVLVPGGICLATAFLMNPPARAALRTGAGRLAFDPEGNGPVYFADPVAPLAAVAFDEDALVAAFASAGLRRRAPATYGCWSGRDLPAFQDICVFDRE